MTKEKIMLMIAMIMMITSCSDDEKTTDILPPSDNYVSTITVRDKNSAETAPAKIKFLYDKQRRITRIEWGTAVPGRPEWNIIYGDGTIHFRHTGDSQSAERYCIMGADSTAYTMHYQDEQNTAQASVQYSGGTMVTAQGTAEGGISASYDFAWTRGCMTGISTVIRRDGRDSLALTSQLVYDDFLPNNTNIDYNIILNTLNAVPVRYFEAPMLLGFCGTKSARLMARHTFTAEYPGHPEKTVMTSFSVLRYSMDNGRITSIETLDDTSARHLVLDITYKR